MPRQKKRRLANLELCEPRLLLAVEPFISEFMASNDATLTDDFGESSDWIEITNPGDTSIELDGWYLTDDADNLTKWKFPDVRLEPESHFVVFASGRDSDDPAANLHTNFKLAKGGEFLALVKPDGQTVVSKFGETYPAQLTDISYGVAIEVTETELIPTKSAAQILIPRNGDLGNDWKSPEFDVGQSWLIKDETGRATTTPVGFDQGMIAPDLGRYAKFINADQPVGYWRLEEPTGVVAANNGSLRASANGRYLNNVRQGIDGVLPGSGDRGAEFRQAIRQRIDIPFLPQLNPQSYTIEAWARPDGGFGFRSPFTSRGDSPEEGFAFYVSPENTWEFWTGKGDRGWNKSLGPKIDLGQWTHLVGTYDHGARVQKFYIDGVEVSSIAATSVPSSFGPLRIGSGEFKGQPNYFFDGAIDEVALYNRALPPGRIQTHYQVGKPLPPTFVRSDLFVADFGNPDGGGLGADASQLKLAGQSPQSPTISNPDGRLVLGGGGRGGVVFVEQLPGLNFEKPVSIRTTAFWETGRSVATDGDARFGLVALHRQGTAAVGPNRKGGLFAQFQPRTGGVADMRIGFQTDSTSDNLDSFVVARTKSADGEFDPNGEFDLELIFNGLTDDSALSFYARQGTYTADMRVTIDEFRRALVSGSSTQQAFDVVLSELRETPGLMNVGFLSTAPFGGAGNNVDAYRELRVSEQTISPEPRTADFSHLIDTDIGTSMFDVNSSAYVRIPFSVQQPERFDRLELNMQYDDGFVAYLNGNEIAGRNAPVNLTWNSAALEFRQDTDALVFENVAIPSSLQWLRSGDNVLAIHVLNAGRDNPDVFMQPELLGVSSQIHTSNARYFSHPTPGGPSAPLADDLGPVVYDIRHAPSEPVPGQDIVISASVAESTFEVDAVSLTYRVMYGQEKRTPMHDDGQGHDILAADGIYTAVLPRGIAQAGQMVRYFVETRDAAGNAFQSPQLPESPDGDRTPQYHGTVIADGAVNTPLPIFYWFVPDANWHRSRASNNKNWSPASVYFDGKFYDNLQVRVRGLTTVSWNKPKFKFEFNNGYEFQYSPDQEPVDEFNLQSHFRETGAVSYMGETLAFNWLREIGVPAPLVMPMHVRQNGNFYSLATFVEQIDETFLERNGFDPDGAMYKANSGAVMSTLKVNPSPAHYRKVTRKEEPFDDLKEFTDGINNRLRGIDRADYIFDTVNLPEVINDMAGNVIMPNHDRLTKNYYMHFDVLGNGEWSRFPWDMDQAFARFTVNHFSSVLYGDSEHPQSPNPIHQNHLYDAILDTPATRAMYLRRVKTLLDEYMTTGYFEKQVDEYFSLLAIDADLDHDKWGAGNIRAGVNRIKENIRFRQRQLINEGLLPASNVAFRTTTLLGENSGVKVFVPQDHSLALSWTQPGFDDSRWTAGTSGIGFDNRRNANYLPDINTTIEPSNVCAQCVSLYSRFSFQVDGPSAFNGLTLRMKYDDGFIAYLNGTEIHRENFSGAPAWNSTTGRLSPNATTYVDFDVSDHVDLMQPGDNVLAIHGLNATRFSTDLLVRPQLLGRHRTLNNVNIDFGAVEFNPPSGNQDEEYMQIVNKSNDSVDLSGWIVRGGIEFEFQPGTVIPANDSLYLSPNVRAFRNRGEGPSGGQGLFVQGDYDGHLSNFGETIELVSKDRALISSHTTPAVPSDLQKYLRVSEIHYHPEANPDAEFIEITNTSDQPGVTLDLSGVTITEGPSQPMTFDPNTRLEAGEVLLVVKDRAAFTSTFGNVDVRRIAGEFQGSLNNSGESIKIEDPNQSTIVEFAFRDVAPWPELADGKGASLHLKNLESPPDDAGSWIASTPTPGRLLTINADLNGDGTVNAMDIDRLCAAIHDPDTAFDYTGDDQVNHADLRFFVEDVLRSRIGDVDLDGVFDSSDLVRVFQVGEYEDDLAGNSTWSEGDWNCDGEFSSSDVVFAFQSGGYADAVKTTKSRQHIARFELGVHTLRPIRALPSDSNAGSRKWK